MMTPRENFISLMKRQGYENAPVHFDMCPSLEREFEERTGSKGYYEYYKMPWRALLVDMERQDDEQYHQYYPEGIKPGATIDSYGVLHELGSEAAMHMTRMVSPMRSFTSVQQIEDYQYPAVVDNLEEMKEKIDTLHARGLAAMGQMQCTIWEQAWYLRGMEELLMDMMSDDPMANAVFDKITDLACQKATLFAKAGTDAIFLGDDIGMQHTIMMSVDLYAAWIKPRLKKVIDTIKEINQDALIFYHSCGYVEPFIPHLIEVGVDVLNPIQPECMDFEKIYAKYGDQLSFHGVIGTQTTMPFGTTEEVKALVHRLLSMAGKKGGIYCAPTHLLEPEVPYENIEAYVEACREFVPK